MRTPVLALTVLALLPRSASADFKYLPDGAQVLDCSPAERAVIDAQVAAALAIIDYAAPALVAAAGPGGPPDANLLAEIEFWAGKMPEGDPAHPSDDLASWQDVLENWASMLRGGATSLRNGELTAVCPPASFVNCQPSIADADIHAFYVDLSDATETIHMVGFCPGFFTYVDDPPYWSKAAILVHELTHDAYAIDPDGVAANNVMGLRKLTMNKDPVVLLSAPHMAACAAGLHDRGAGGYGSREFKDDGSPGCSVSAARSNTSITFLFVAIAAVVVALRRRSTG